MSPYVAPSMRPWKGKEREQPALLVRSGGEAGVVLPLDMLETSTYEAVYTIPLVVGSNQQSLSVQVDTGSSDLWIASTSCGTQACKQTGGRLYDPSHSTPTNKNFQIEYVEGEVDGPIVWDTVQLGGYTIDSQALAAASTVNDEPLSGDFSGVLGLALPLNSVIEEQIHPTTNNAPDGAMLASNLFTMTPSSSTPESRFLSLSLERPGSSTIPSLIGIGQHPSQLVQDPSKIQYSPVASTSNGALWWQAHIWAVTVYVDGQPKQVTLSTSSSTRFSPTAVIDSGMPIIMASKSIADGIYGALGIGPASDGNYYLSCTTPINMTVTLDNRTAIALHPLDLSTPNSDSSCLGLIQAYPEGSEVANIADIVLGVPFMRSTYTVMAYDTPDSHGNFPNASAMPSPNINPSLGLLGLTNPTVALQEFHTVRVLNQPLPNGGQGNSGHTATAPTSGKKLSVGVEVLIGLLGFFGLCFLLFAARWAYYKRSMEQSGAKATKDEVMMEDVAYRLARRSSYGSRYGPSEETIRAQKFGEYMQHQGEVKSMYADETGRTRVADDVDNEKYTDAELGYRKVKVHSDSDSEGELTPPPGTTIFNTRSTRATLISPLAIDDNAVAAVQVLELPRPISTSDYPPSPSPSHHRLVSSEASVAMPLLAHTRSDSHISLRDSGTSGRVALGLGRPAGHARVGSDVSVRSANDGSGSGNGTNGRPSRLTRVPSGPRGVSPSLVPPPSLLNFGSHDVSQASFSAETTNGHVS